MHPPGLPHWRWDWVLGCTSVMCKEWGYDLELYTVQEMVPLGWAEALRARYGTKTKY